MAFYQLFFLVLSVPLSRSHLQPRGGESKSIRNFCLQWNTNSSSQASLRCKPWLTGCFVPHSGEWQTPSEQSVRQGRQLFAEPDELGCLSGAPRALQLVTVTHTHWPSVRALERVQKYQWNMFWLPVEINVCAAHCWQLLYRSLSKIQSPKPFNPRRQPLQLKLKQNSVS